MSRSQIQELYNDYAKRQNQYVSEGKELDKILMEIQAQCKHPQVRECVCDDCGKCRSAGSVKS